MFAIEAAEILQLTEDTYSSKAVHGREHILPIIPTLHEFPVGVQVVMQISKIPQSLASEILGIFCRQRCICKTPALPFEPVSLTMGHIHTHI